MARDSGSDLSSAFDNMLENNRRRFDDLYGGAPRAAPARPQSPQRRSTPKSAPSSGPRKAGRSEGRNFSFSV